MNVRAVLVSVGALALCIGAYFATVIIYFSWMHLHKQLYRLYLSRGGEPIPVSPGNSGGPLILCRGGSLGGIVTLQSRITNVQNVNFATPAQYLLDKETWDFQSGEEKAQQMLDTAIAQAKK